MQVWGPQHRFFFFFCHLAKQWNTYFGITIKIEMKSLLAPPWDPSKACKTQKAHKTHKTQKAQKACRAQSKACGAWPHPPGSLEFSGLYMLFGLFGFYGFYGFRGLTPPKPLKPRKPIKHVKPKKPIKPTVPTEPVGSRCAFAGDLVGFIPVGPGRTLRGRLVFLGSISFLGFLGFMGFMGF